MTVSGDWQATAQAKQAERLSKIPKAWMVPPEHYKNRKNMMDIPETCGILTVEELDVTSNYDATALLEKLHAGTFTAEAVVTAFCKRAAIAQQLTNCLTEIFFEDAIARARQLDTSRTENQSASLLPLWGLPISLKDTFQVPGVDCSCGIASLVGDPSSVYSTLPKMLVDLGAVLYVKSNVPQTLMTADSDNNVFGRTLNPHNTGLTAGGSTGGEGALLALRGSVLGVGTDIAGSVRIPSLCNGTYALRPSNHVIPHSGQRKISVPGVEGVKAVTGPMSVSIRDCTLFMRTVVKAKPWEHDSASNRTIWQGLKPPAPGQVTIGLVEDYGHVTLHPPVLRTLRESAEKLKRAGVKVVPITLPNVAKNYNNLLKFFQAPGNAPLRKMLLASGEPEVTSVKRLNMVNGERPQYSLSEYLELFIVREEAQTKTREVYQKYGLDAIISPGAPYVAVPHDKYTDVAFTGLWNYLDCPATIVPVGKVEEGDVISSYHVAQYGKHDEEISRLYTGPSDFKDAPTAIQVIGKRQHDEELLAITELIDSILKP